MDIILKEIVAIIKEETENINKKIYGTTTAKERQELAEEGIDLLSIPWVEKDN